MMAEEYVKREAVLEILRKKSPGTYRGVPCYPDEISASFREVNKLPAADVVEVRHELWVHDYNNLYGCTGCGERETMSRKKMKKFCSNCGARMDGGNP